MEGNGEHKSSWFIRHSTRKLSPLLKTIMPSGSNRSLPEFTWNRSDATPTLTPLTAALLEQHSRSKTMEFKQATGGVLPVCVDESQEAWCLLGENHRLELCHFHGWIDPGETFEMGAAREAYEESRGILGDALTVWRAICDPVHSRRCNAMVALSLGTLSAAQRRAMCSDFESSRIVCRGMTEVRRLWWLPLRALRELCLGPPRREAVAAADDCATEGPRSQAHIAAPSPLPAGLKIRPFLLQTGWLGRGGLWHHPDVHQLLEQGVFNESWRRLQDVACISAGEAAHLCNTLAHAVAGRRRSDHASSSADDRRTRRRVEP